MGRFPYKGQTVNVLSVRERELPGKKRECEGKTFVEAMSQVDVMYKASKRMTLNDAQEPARLASMED